MMRNKQESSGTESVVCKLAIDTTATIVTDQCKLLFKKSVSWNDKPITQSLKKQCTQPTTSTTQEAAGKLPLLSLEEFASKTIPINSKKEKNIHKCEAENINISFITLWQ